MRQPDVGQQLLLGHMEVVAVACGQNDAPDGGFSRVRKAPGYGPVHPACHRVPHLAHGDVRVSPGEGGAVDRCQQPVEATGEIRLDVLTALSQRFELQNEDLAGLRVVAWPEAGMVAMRQGRHVGIDPGAVVGLQGRPALVPVGANSQGITDEGAHDGAYDPVFA